MTLAFSLAPIVALVVIRQRRTAGRGDRRSTAAVVETIAVDAVVIGAYVTVLQLRARRAAHARAVLRAARSSASSSTARTWSCRSCSARSAMQGLELPRAGVGAGQPGVLVRGLGRARERRAHRLHGAGRGAVARRARGEPVARGRAPVDRLRRAARRDVDDDAGARRGARRRPPARGRLAVRQRRSARRSPCWCARSSATTSASG